MFYVYVLHSSKTGRRYVGSCADLDRRVQRHNLGHSKATRHGVPWILVHSETFSNRADATRRDDIIKEVVVATNLINYNVRTVAAATGRGFESRRPDFQV